MLRVSQYTSIGASSHLFRPRLSSYALHNIQGANQPPWRVPSKGPTRFFTKRPWSWLFGNKRSVADEKESQLKGRLGREKTAKAAQKLKADNSVKPKSNETSSPSSKSEKIQLRPYQQECIDKCLSMLAKGTKRQMLSLPVASGKTVIAAHLIPQIPPPLTGATKTLFLAHREELWDQAYNQIKSAGLGLKVTRDHGKHVPDMDADVFVASVPSLGGADSNGLKKYDLKEFKCILIDEAHHAVTDTYLRILDHFGANTADSHIAVVGLSATVKRQDNIKLGTVFNVISVHRSLESMIADEWLCKLLVKTIRINSGQNLRSIKMGRDDFQRKDLSRKINTPERNEAIVQGYIDNCATRMSTIAFAADISHVEALTRAFQQHGLDARAVSGRTPNAERKHLVNGFRERKFPILINCGILTEGTDIPAIDSILIARPTKSQVLLQQILGRGMRLYEGKKNCLVLDFVDVVGDDYLGIQPTLEGLDPKRVLMDDEEESLPVELQTPPHEIQAEEAAGALEDIENTMRRVHIYKKIGQLLDELVRILRHKQTAEGTAVQNRKDDTSLYRRVKFTEEEPGPAINNTPRSLKGSVGDETTAPKRSESTVPPYSCIKPWRSAVKMPQNYWVPSTSADDHHGQNNDIALHPRRQTSLDQQEEEDQLALASEQRHEQSDVGADHEATTTYSFRVSKIRDQLYTELRDHAAMDATSNRSKDVAVIQNRRTAVVSDELDDDLSHSARSFRDAEKVEGMRLKQSEAAAHVYDLHQRAEKTNMIHSRYFLANHLWFASTSQDVESLINKGGAHKEDEEDQENRAQSSMRMVMLALKKDYPKEPEVPGGYNPELPEENHRHSPPCAMVAFKPPDNKLVLYSPKANMFRGVDSDVGRHRRYLDSVSMLTWVKSLLDHILQSLLPSSDGDAAKTWKVERHIEEKKTGNKQE